MQAAVFLAGLERMLAAALALSADDYSPMREAAIALQKPFVVGVGCDVPKGNWIGCRIPAPFASWSKPCLIVSHPGNRDLLWLADLPPTATAKQIHDTLHPPRQAAPAAVGSPAWFQQRRPPAKVFCST